MQIGTVSYMMTFDHQRRSQARTVTLSRTTTNLAITFAIRQHTFLSSATHLGVGGSSRPTNHEKGGARWLVCAHSYLVCQTNLQLRDAEAIPREEIAVAHEAAA